MVSKFGGIPVGKPIRIIWRNHVLVIILYRISLQYSTVSLLLNFYFWLFEVNCIPVPVPKEIGTGTPNLYR